MIKLSGLGEGFLSLDLSFVCLYYSPLEVKVEFLDLFLIWDPYTKYVLDFLCPYRVEFALKFKSWDIHKNTCWVMKNKI